MPSPRTKLTAEIKPQRALPKIIVVVPCYDERNHIGPVLKSIPDYIYQVIVVDDASGDDTPDVVKAIAEKDPRITLLRNQKNLGVGGAVIRGYKKALEMGCDIVVKMDGDGQMASRDLPRLIAPLLHRKADYSKGNRFFDYRLLSEMPFIRCVGNSILSYLTKLACGYWNIFDPTNGFTAIRREALVRLPLHNISKSFFFETSLLYHLYLLGAVVSDVNIPPKYGDEESSLSIPSVFPEFSFRLVFCFLKRFFIRHFVYEFSIAGLYMTAGTSSVLWGLIFGIVKWVSFSRIGHGAPTGTVVIPAVLLIVGFQLLLSAVAYDIQSVPVKPISEHLEEDIILQ